MTLRELLASIMPLFVHLDVECYDGDSFCDELHTALLGSVVQSYSFHGIESDFGWRNTFDDAYVNQIAVDYFHSDDEPILTVRLANIVFDQRLSIRYDADGRYIRE